MKLGIVGLPNVGKSTLFNAITSTKNAEAANYPFCTIEPNSGIVAYGYHSNAWYGCIKCHHWSFDWMYHDSSVCNPCGICFLTIYHRKIIEYLIRGRFAKIKS